LNEGAAATQFVSSETADSIDFMMPWAQGQTVFLVAGQDWQARMAGKDLRLPTQNYSR
jgi:hypothetical protein